MRRLFFATLLFASAPAVAQQPAVRPGNDVGTGQSLPLSNNASNIVPGDTSSPIAPRLPSPAVGENAPPAAYLHAARSALLLGRTGEAQEALERAESRLLDRATLPSRANQPARSPLLLLLGEARGAVARGDRLTAIHLVERALREPELERPAG